ncbi:MAG: SGNH/GDSL hydrolase family protein [Nanoarchaeota archaeon]
MKFVCVFGASITQGFNDYKEGGWCDSLKREFFSKGLAFHNLGISGDKTTDLLERFELEVKPRNPDAIIFSIGLNNTQYFPDTDEFRVSLDDTIKDFNALIEKALKYTSNIIILGLTKVNEDIINADYIPRKKKCLKNEYIKNYNEQIEKFAKKNNIKFIPLLDILDEDDLNDGLHPDTKGHWKIFEKIKDNISAEDF